MQLCAASMARVELRLLLLLQILSLASLVSAQLSFDYENDFGSAVITTDPTLVDQENDFGSAVITADPTLVDQEGDDDESKEDGISFDGYETTDICDDTYPLGETVKSAIYPEVEMV